MKVDMPCGFDRISLNLPPGAEILEPRSVPPLDDPEESVEAALQNPIDSPPLERLATGRTTACIVISDITRPVPNQVILPPLLRTLESAGIRRENITILIATGTHAPNEGQELEQLVGGHIAANYTMVNHDCRDRDRLRRIGDLQGAPVEINTVYLDAELKILTGLIEPHPFAGYSGGAKSILPGLSSMKTMKYMHSFEMVAHPMVDNCILEGNPFYRATLDVARLAGADFIVNTAINRAKEPVAFFAGRIESAHFAGSQMVAEFSVIRMNEPADLVISSGGGAPMDRTFYQSTKGLVCAKNICRPGATVILVSGCADGFGSDQFCELSACGGFEEFKKRYSAPENFVLDQWAVQCNLQAMSRMGRVMVYSPNLDEKRLRNSGLEKVNDLQDEVDRLCRVHSKVAAIPQGPYVVGLLGEGEEGHAL
jgi:nickel-dependent lactate racemase